MKTTTHKTSTHVAGLVAAALLCGMPGVLPAQETAAPAEPNKPAAAGKAAHVGAKFADFAGSEENATALVTGLHAGSAITLTGTVDGQIVTTEFQPATGKMGYGNAAISLALAQESLNKAGITDPTPAQIVAALNGGTVTGSGGTATALAGVLTLRAAGEGWGAIAKTLGVKVGPLMRQFHASHHRHDRPDRPAAVNRFNGATRATGAMSKPPPVHRPTWAGTPRPHIQRMPNIPHITRPGKH